MSLSIYDEPPLANLQRPDSPTLLQRMRGEPGFRLLLSQLALPPRARVLDIGCGAGQLLASVVRCFPDVQAWGVDLRRAALERRPQPLPRVRMVQADSQQLPFPGKCFDAVLSTHTFHQFANQQLAATEMFRIVKPGGELLVIDGLRDGAWGHMLYERLLPTIEGDGQHASRDELRQLFEAAGFEVLRQQRGGWLLPYLLTHCRAPQRGRPAVPAPHFRVFGGTSRSTPEPLHPNSHVSPTKRRAA